jgi:FAD synthase
MRVLHGIESLPQTPRGGVLIVGNFDGIGWMHPGVVNWQGLTPFRPPGV